MIEYLFGTTGNELSVLQMGSRAAVVFFVALIFIRIAGIRAFGMRSPLDNIILLLLGAILSHAVVGDIAFFPTLAACFIIVLLHRILAIISLYSPLFGRLMKGSAVPLIKDGEPLKDNMNKSLISNHDMEEAVRLRGRTEKLHDVKAAYLERSGEISIVKKAE